MGFSKKSFYSALLGLLPVAMSACTKSDSPTVNILDRSAFFKVSSANPFSQDNAGGYIRMTGSCLANVQKFQLQWDGGPWVDVPTTAPTPATDEYLLDPAPPFDQNCADRAYDFYVFISTVKAMFGLSGDVHPTIGIGVRPVGTGYVGEAIFYAAPTLAAIQFTKDDFSNPTKIVVGNPTRYSVRFLSGDGSRASVSGASFLFAASATDGTNVTNLSVYSCPSGNTTIDGNCSNITGANVAVSDDSAEFWINPTIQSGWTDPSRYQISLSASCVSAGCQATPGALSVATRSSTDYRTYLSMASGFPSRIVSGIAYSVMASFNRYDQGSFALGSMNEFSIWLKDLSGSADLTMSGSGCTQTGDSLDCHVMGSGSSTSGMTSPSISLTVNSGIGFRLGLGDKNLPSMGVAYAFDGTSAPWIDVDQSGSVTYVAPAVQKLPQKLNENGCLGFLVVAGNHSGAALPSSGQHFVKVEVLDKNSSVIAGSLYPSTDSSCSSAGSNLVSAELDNGLPWLDLRMKVSSMPVDGQIVVRTVETTTLNGTEIPATERKTTLYWDSH